MLRTSLLIGDCPADAQILEIGPSHNPVAPKAGGWRTHTVDYTDRAGLLEKFTGDSSVDATRIEEVDTVWRGGPLHQAIPRSLHGSFDRLIASHVIEHLPDLAGFLLSAQILLKPDGIVALAVPDRRYCFDYFKPPSMTGDVLEAFHLRRTRHPVRTAWNHVAYSVTGDGSGAWGQHPIREWQFMDTLSRAAGATERAIGERGEYEDFHAWHFTPATFELMILELAQIGVTDWRIQTMHGPQGCEFICLLRRGAPRIDDPEELQSRRLALLRRTLDETRQQLDHLAESLPAPAQPAAVPRMRPRVVAAALARFQPRRHSGRSDEELLAHSGLFDREWYLRQVAGNPSARRAPELHYLIAGADAGLDPSPNFHTKWYLDSNEDVARSGINPLLHYATWGRIEGRLPIPLTEWMTRYAGPSAQAPDAPDGPSISIVMPVCDPPPRYLRRAVESVFAQQYGNWELCIADDASTIDEVRAIVSEFAADPRVRVVRSNTRNGISANSNAACALASGAYIALLDHDDLLAPHALAVVARCLKATPSLDLVYTDEVLIDADDQPIGGYFKPGWNRDLLLGHNLVSHLGVYRRALVEQLGGFRSDFDGSQDYDLALRVAGVAGPGRVRHIPQPLYLWRRVHGTFSESRAQRCAAVARLAVAESLLPDHPNAQVTAAPGAFLQNRVRFSLPQPRPKTTLVLCAHRRSLVADVDLLLSRLRNATAYPDVEPIVLVAQPAAVTGALAIVAADPASAAARNRAASRASGDVLVFLDLDLAPTAPGWLDELVAQALRAEVGAVGGKVISAEGRVLHAGFGLDPQRIAVALHRGIPDSASGYHGQLVLLRETGAVSAACLATRRAVFEELGGFDSRMFPAAFHDVDWCLRARRKGFRITWTPFATFASPERYDQPPAPAISRAAERRMRARWRNEIAADPFENPNLVREGYGLSVPPRGI